MSGALRCDHLRDHAALREGACCAAGHLFQSRISGTGTVHKDRVRILSRIRREEPLLIREDHESVSFNEVRHHGAQGVVISHLDFVRDNRVVLIDHRNDAKGKQREERGARVEVTRTVSKIRSGEENLRGLYAAFREFRFVGLGKTHLAHGSRGLKLSNLSRPALPAKASHTFSDGA